MTSVSFDTLKFANKLKTAAIPPAHAEAEAEALEEVLKTNLQESRNGKALARLEANMEKGFAEVDLRFAQINQRFSEVKGIDDGDAALHHAAKVLVLTSLMQFALLTGDFEFHLQDAASLQAVAPLPDSTRSSSCSILFFPNAGWHTRLEQGLSQHLNKTPKTIFSMHLINQNIIQSLRLTLITAPSETDST